MSESGRNWRVQSVIFWGMPLGKKLKKSCKRAGWNWTWKGAKILRGQ